MPFYQLICDECGNKFEKLASVSDRDRGILCPECGAHTHTDYSKGSAAVQLNKSKASECPNAHVCGGGCRHGAGH